MTDLITHLAARTLQLTPVVQPRIDSVFAAQQTSGDWQSVSQSAGISSVESIPPYSLAVVEGSLNRSEAVSPTSSPGTKQPTSLVSPASPVLPIAHIPRLAELPFPSGGLAMSSGRAVEQEAPSCPDPPETGAIESSDTATSQATWQPSESIPAAPINVPGGNLNLPPQPNTNPVENLSLPIAPPLPPAPLVRVTDSAALPLPTEKRQTSSPSGFLAGSPDNRGKLPSASTTSSIQAVHFTQAGEAKATEATALKPDAVERQILQSPLREELPVSVSQPTLKPLIKPASLSVAHPSSIADPVTPQGAVPIAQPRFHAAESSIFSRSSISSISSPRVPPVVNITIGRIDIRAVPAASPPPTRRAVPASPKLTLQDYLNTRNGGGG